MTQLEPKLLYKRELGAKIQIMLVITAASLDWAKNKCVLKFEDVGVLAS